MVHIHTPEEQFAVRAARDAALYQWLARHEQVPAFRTALTTLADISCAAYAFWQGKTVADAPIPTLSWFTKVRYRLMRAALGVTLTAKYILGRKETRVARYKEYCTTCTVDEDHRAIEALAERMHAVVGDIEEERVAFYSNVVLGFNDALIELTGALVGFSFALRDPKLISISGLVTGLSASLSMAASAYQQARHEDGRDPYKAALFTGIAYFVIAVVLVLPFVLTGSVPLALAVMGVLVLVMTAAISFYSSVLLDQKYLSQFGEMLVFSVGVAFIAFIIGHAFNLLII